MIFPVWLNFLVIFINCNFVSAETSHFTLTQTSSHSTRKSQSTSVAHSSSTQNTSTSTFNGNSPPSWLLFGLAVFIFGVLSLAFFFCKSATGTVKEQPTKKSKKRKYSKKNAPTSTPKWSKNAWRAILLNCCLSLVCCLSVFSLPYSSTKRICWILHSIYKLINLTRCSKNFHFFICTVIDCKNF